MTMRVAGSLAGAGGALMGATGVLGEAAALDEALVLVMLVSRNAEGARWGPLAAELMGVLWSAAADPVVYSVTMDSLS